MPKFSISPNYTAAIVIAHGQSEELIARHVKSCLKLNMLIHTRCTSIQVNGLLHELETNFKNIPQLKKHQSIELDIRKNKIINDFKIFTIMDTDDCSNDEVRKSYIDGSMFQRYALKEHVVPIYTSPKLENVFFECKLIPKIFKDKEKIKGYQKLFDIPKIPYGETKSEEMKKFSQQLTKSQNTNFELFLDYCIEQAEARSIIR